MLTKEEKLVGYANMLTRHHLMHAVSRRRYDYLKAPDTVTTVSMNDERGLWLATHKPELVKWVE